MRFYSYIFTFILVLGLGTHSANAQNKAPKGSVLIPSRLIYTATDKKKRFLCGHVRGWEPGRMVGKDKSHFMPFRMQIRNLKQRIKKASGIKKANAERRLAKLQLNTKRARKACRKNTPAAHLLDPLALYSKTITEDDVYHLYRRAGLGVPHPQAFSYVGRNADQLAAYFLTYVNQPEVDHAAYIYVDGNIAEPHYPANNPDLNGIHAYTLAVLSKTRNQFHERFALLSLLDRLAVASRAVNVNAAQRNLYMDYLNLLREYSKGDMDYAKLVEEIGENGAMVRWLTLDGNNRSAPNEDYARELMELFTLDTKNVNGQPNYSDLDIIQVARAFTGWSVTNRIENRWRTVFLPDNFDNDPRKIIFWGTPYQGTVTNGRDVVRHIFAAHPNAPISLAKFIAREYVREDASDEFISRLAEVIKANNYKLKNVFQTLLSSEEFYKAENRLAVARTPSDRFIHLIRIMDSVGMPYPNFLTIASSLRNNMGCILTQTETVFGCVKMQEMPEGQRLLNSTRYVTTLANEFNNLENYRLFYPNANPSDMQLVGNFEKIFGIKLTAERKRSVLDYLNSNMSNDGTLLDSPWDPQGSIQYLRRKVAGLFRIFANMPEMHDVR